MPCFHPVEAYQLTGESYKGAPLLFSVNACAGRAYRRISVPCGKCVGCRVKNNQMWALRCMYESTLYERNCFITLTFAKDTNSLNKQDFVKFMKRLRKSFPSDKIRFFHCGEYGTQLSRPHHHAILFNFDFSDKTIWSVNNGRINYRSKTLERIWPYGFSLIGSVTPSSCAYVARYINKKITGDHSSEHYAGRVPEYITMSNRPGIAHDWFYSFIGDVYPHDYCVGADGRKRAVPRYFDKLLDRHDSSALEPIKNNRMLKAIEYMRNPDANPNRLAIREACLEAKLALYNRPYESGESEYSD